MKNEMILGSKSIDRSLILVGEPALAYLQEDKAFIVETTNAAKKAIIDGLLAKMPDSKNPDHKTRILYLKTVIDMNCWSADSRMTIRNHIRQVARDRMEFDSRLMGQGTNGGRGLQVPPEAAREMKQ